MIELVLEPDMLWTVIVGFIIAFVLAFGIGANDVANSFGTSVGSRVLTLRQACILACVFETLGAILIGSKVSDTIRKGIIDVGPYKNDTDLLMIGNVAALSGSCVWLIAATLLRLPVSATHSIVGATVGFALVAHGAKGIHWHKLGLIIGSWFISPILAGLVSSGIFFVCKHFILTKMQPLEAGLKFLPVFYAVTVVINLFSVFYHGPKILGFDKIPLWGTFILSFGSGIICALVVRFAVVPWLRIHIKAMVGRSEEAVEAGEGDLCPGTGEICEYTPVSSAGGSLDTSRRNSVDKVPATAMVEVGEVCNEKEHAANNFLKPPEVTSASLKEPRGGTEKKSCLKTMNSYEGASLMDNEYKLGTVTPVKGNPPTEEELNTANKALAANGTKAESASNGTGSDVRILPESPEKAADKSLEEEKEESGRSVIQDKPETARLFSVLQILTAIFGAFAHGGNDVSNAIGPLVSVWLTARYGLVEDKLMTPVWILLFGGVGISLGLCILGRRVIKTMGDDLSKITPSSGFCIEIGSALTVLVASNIGIPISTTHCKVGSVVFVGRSRSRENVDWSLFRNIVLAWLVTLPITGGISAAMMAGLMLTLD